MNYFANFSWSAQIKKLYENINLVNVQTMRKIAHWQSFLNLLEPAVNTVLCRLWGRLRKFLWPSQKNFNYVPRTSLLISVSYWINKSQKHHLFSNFGLALANLFSIHFFLMLEMFSGQLFKQSSIPNFWTFLCWVNFAKAICKLLKEGLNCPKKDMMP